MLQSFYGARQSDFSVRNLSRGQQLIRVVVTTLLFLLQPIVRLTGRIAPRLFLLSQPRVKRRFGPIWGKSVSIWMEKCHSSDFYLSHIRNRLISDSVTSGNGGDFDPWDIEVRGGILGAGRLLLAIEEHGDGKQYLNYRVWPVCTRCGFIPIVLFGLLAAAAFTNAALLAGAILIVPVLVYLAGTIVESASATAKIMELIQETDRVGNEL